jgi:hypothetical protein
MSTNIITIEIAEAIKNALSEVVPNGTTIYADGIDDSPAGADEVKLPCVTIVVSECIPQAYRSVLRSYPVEIQIASWYPDDKNQETLYTIAHAVAQWLAEPTDLNLTLAHYDALVIDSEPVRGVDGRIQYMNFRGHVNTRKKQT